MGNISSFTAIIFFFLHRRQPADPRVYGMRYFFFFNEYASTNETIEKSFSDKEMKYNFFAQDRGWRSVLLENTHISDDLLYI